MIPPEDVSKSREVGVVHRARLHENPHAPLIVLVHGRAGTVSVMSIFERCLPSHASVILVQAPEPDPQGGFSWFIGTTFRDGSVMAAPVLKGYIEQLCDYYHLTPSRTVGVGFSQGGMVLSALVQQSTILDAVALVASMPIITDQQPRSDAFQVFGVHGSNDETLPLEHVLPWYEKLRQLHFNLCFITEQGLGHKVGSEGMRQLTAWINNVLAVAS